MKFPLLCRALWAIRGRPKPSLAPPKLSTTDVTIIVLDWNRCDDTLVCLGSLKAAELGGASILVVDNGSLERLGRFGQIQLLRRVAH